MMMKFLLAICLALFFLTSGCTDHTSEIPASEPKVKTLTSVEFYNEHGVPDSARFSEKVVQTFDTNGVRIELKRFIVDSTILYDHDYQVWQGDTMLQLEWTIGNVYKQNIEVDTLFYLHGNLIRRSVIGAHRFEYDDWAMEHPIPIVSTITYEYDSLERMIFSSQLSDGKQFDCQYFYDTHGNQIKQACVHLVEEDHRYVVERNFNEKDLKTYQGESTIYGDSVAVFIERFLDYDQRDSLVYQSWYKNRSNFGVYYYAYDSLGNMLSETVYGVDGDSTALQMKTIRSYNDLSQMVIERKSAGDGGLMSETHFTYDSLGFLKEEIHYWGDSLPPEKNYSTTKKINYYRTFYD